MQQYECDAREGEGGDENATDDDDDHDNHDDHNDHDHDHEDGGDEMSANGPTGGGGPSAIHMDLFYNDNDRK